MTRYLLPNIQQREGLAFRLLSTACLLPLLAWPLPVAAATAAPGASTPRPTFSSCRLEGVAEPARCFELPVAENPAAPGGRTISLKVSILPATDGVASARPLFILAGGPGQSARSLAPYALRFLGNKGRRSRDLVFADVRGTGDSNPLDCNLGEPLQRGEGLLSNTEVDACLAELGKKADLRFYSTYHAMHDLDLVRQALGAEQIDLWGGSYGTRAAMVYQKLFPAQTHAIVLDGVAPYEVTLPAFYAREGQRALDLLFARCTGDAACHAMLPAPRATLDALLARLAETPAHVHMLHPRKGMPIDFTLTRNFLTGTLRLLLYAAEGASFVPFLLDRAEQGDFVPLASALVTAMETMDKTMSLGFTFSVVCSEDMPFIDRDLAESSSRGTFLGTADLDAWTAVCARWPRTELPKGFAEIPTSQVPALLLSGELDPVVPPVWGEVALGFFPRGRHLIVPGTAHNTSHVGCTGRLIRAFLDSASASSLDAECLESIKAPPFITSFAGAQP